MTGKRGSFPLLIVFLCTVIIVGTAAYVFWAKTEDLKAKEQEAIMREEVLNKKIDEQDERNAQLQEEKRYVNTDEYIEDVAREKLGLINPNEVLFKENEEN